MALTSDDLQRISDIVKAQNEPILKRLDSIEGRLTKIEGRLDDIEKRLGAIEKWIPVDNTYILRKLVTM